MAKYIIKVIKTKFGFNESIYHSAYWDYVISINSIILNVRVILVLKNDFCPKLRLIFKDRQVTKDKDYSTVREILVHKFTFLQGIGIIPRQKDIWTNVEDIEIPDLL